MAIVLSGVATIAREASVSLSGAAIIARAESIVLSGAATIAGNPGPPTEWVTRRYSAFPVQRVTYGAAARYTIRS